MNPINFIRAIFNMVARVQQWPKGYEGDQLYSDCISGPLYRRKGFPGTVTMSNNPRLIGEAIIMIQSGHSLKLPSTFIQLLDSMVGD